MPHLVLPTVAVRDSFLAGMRALCLEDGTAQDWLDEAAKDFGQLVAKRTPPQQMWGVPITELWYTTGAVYLGTIMVRHQLTPELRRDGGNIGYHVVPAHRRRGHATAMLAEACAWCYDRGMTKLLVTCSADNSASRRVIEANGGVREDQADRICRYWITLPR